MEMSVVTDGVAACHYVLSSCTEMGTILTVVCDILAKAWESTVNGDSRDLPAIMSRAMRTSPSRLEKVT